MVKVEAAVADVKEQLDRLEQSMEALCIIPSQFVVYDSMHYTWNIS